MLPEETKGFIGMMLGGLAVGFLFIVLSIIFS
jgi:hypothetical protein